MNNDANDRECSMPSKSKQADRQAGSEPAFITLLVRTYQHVHGSSNTIPRLGLLRNPNNVTLVVLIIYAIVIRSSPIIITVYHRRTRMRLAPFSSITTVVAASIGGWIHEVLCADKLLLD
jgi:hypothetical protein